MTGLRSAGRLALLGVALACVGLAAPSSVVGAGVFALIYAVAAIGLSIQMGQCGLVNLGHAGFFAAGGYAQAILVTRHDVPVIVGAVASVALVAAAAAVVGLPLLRLTGYQLALGTLGFGVILGVVAADMEQLGGTTGLLGVPKLEFNGRSYDSPREYFLLLIPVVLVILAAAMNLTRSRMGLAMRAVRDSEVAAESMGINSFRVRWAAFVVGSAMAALAGVLSVHWVSLVNPGASGFSTSIKFLLIVVLGGLASPVGALVGAIAVQLLDELLAYFVPFVAPGRSGEVELLAFGLALVLVLMVLPGGLMSRSLSRLRPTRRAAADEVRATADPIGQNPPSFLKAQKGGDARVPVLAVAGLAKTYGGVTAVRDVDLTVHQGEVVGLIGPNGAGKTTLFNLISGVTRPTSGSITVNGVPTAGRAPHVFAAAGAARTFQNLQTLDSATVFENVMTARHQHGNAGFTACLLGLTAKQEEERNAASATEVLNWLGLGAVADRRATEVSFGTQRRLDLARAVASEPRLVLLDEPLAGLSGGERARSLDALRVLRSCGVTVVIVDHDVAAILDLVDRVVVLDGGSVIADGSPAKVSASKRVQSAYLGSTLAAIGGERS